MRARKRQDRGAGAPLSHRARVRDDPDHRALGNDDRVNYAAAKSGMHGFIRSCALELGPYGVTANIVAPGLIVTDMTVRSAKRAGRSLDEHVRLAAERIPVRRTGRPDDIAHAVSFFAGEASGFITGQVLFVSGGPHG